MGVEEAPCREGMWDRERGTKGEGIRIWEGREVNQQNRKDRTELTVAVKSPDRNWYKGKR